MEATTTPFANPSPCPHRNPLAWEPLLVGREAESARLALAEIGRRLLEGECGLPSPADASLAGGCAGQALFFAYLDRVDPQPRYEAQAMRLLECSVAGLDGLLRWRGLFQGPLGVAWCVEHLGGWFLGPAEEDPNGDMDGWLEETLENACQDHPFDLIEGLTGAGLYALSRASRPRGADLLARVLSRLESARVPTPQGKAWFTPPEQLHEHEREDAPQGYFNLGMSHGAAGVVAFLARATEVPQVSGQARGLLDETVPWLLAQRGTDGNVSCFPSWAGPGLSTRPSRLAWCYGDLGIATALLAAGRATDNPGWIAEALAIARHSAGRPEEGSGVRDAALCHGASGVSLAFSRFFLFTGEPCFREAARFWLLWALKQYRPGEEVAGFPLWVARRSPDQPRLPQLGLLEGVAGLGLVLLSALHPVEPGWDRMLLLS